MVNPNHDLKTMVNTLYFVSVSIIPNGGAGLTIHRVGASMGVASQDHLV